MDSDQAGIYEVIWPRRLYLQAESLRAEASMLVGKHVHHVEEAIDILEEAGIYRFRGKKFDGQYLDRMLSPNIKHKGVVIKKRLSAYVQEGAKGK